MILLRYFLFLGLQAAILPSKDLQTFVSGFYRPKDLKKMKMVDKNWIDLEKIYTKLTSFVAPAMVFEHKETNEIFFVKLIGVTYNKKTLRWVVARWSRIEKKIVQNGSYNDAETAAHASDTLARRLMANGEEGHKLHFPDDDTEVYREEKTSLYIGVSYSKNRSKWTAQRWSKTENKIVQNGAYDDEETAAHASDTLAVYLGQMANGEQSLRLNFLGTTEVWAKSKKRKRQDDENLPQNN